MLLRWIRRIWKGRIPTRVNREILDNSVWPWLWRRAVSMALLSRRWRRGRHEPMWRRVVVRIISFRAGRWRSREGRNGVYGA